MSKQKIIPIVIFVILILILAIWVFIVLKDRYASKNPINQNNSELIENKSSESDKEDSDSSNNSQTGTLDGSGETTSPPVAEKEPFVEIERKDCIDGCARFTKDLELTYCRQSCGLALPQDTSRDCTDKTDLDKDYCFKDLAVENKDFDICEKISDKGIKKTCVARITEELLSKQIQNSPPLPE